MRMLADFDQIKTGDCEQLVKKITDADIRKFVEMTGDDNPLHIDRNFAETTAFKDIVVHGMLGASFISTIIGTKLPGPGALWISQSFGAFQDAENAEWPLVTSAPENAGPLNSAIRRPSSVKRARRGY